MTTFNEGSTSVQISGKHPSEIVTLPILLDAEIMNEFFCHLPYHVLEVTSLLHTLIAFNPALKGYDEMLLNGLDAFLKNAHIRKPHDDKLKKK